MRSTKPIAIALLLPLLTFGSVPASALTGDELLKQCSVASNSLERQQCESYIAGVADGINTLMTSMRLLHPDSPSYPKLFCVASSKPVRDLVEATTGYLLRNPGRRHYDAASEVILALEEAFPCTNV
jgi:hypothetical protein